MGKYHSNRYRQSRDTSLEIFPLSSQLQLASVLIDNNKEWTINNVDKTNKQVATTITNFQESQPVNISSHNLFNFGNTTETISVPLTSRSVFSITLLPVSEFDSISLKISFESFLALIKEAKRSQVPLFFKKNTFLGAVVSQDQSFVNSGDTLMLESGDTLLLESQTNLILNSGIYQSPKWMPLVDAKSVFDSYHYSATAFNGIITNLSETIKDKGVATINIEINSTSAIIEDRQVSSFPLINE